eukprot:UN20723
MSDIDLHLPLPAKVIPGLPSLGHQILLT